MYEKPLLLPSAKAAVLVARKSRTDYVRLAAVALGLLCVVVGAADLTSRAVDAVGTNSLSTAFAPLGTLDVQTTAPTSTASGAITPARVRIPVLGVNAAVEPVGAKADGTMGTPQDFDHVSWWSLGAKPGGEGSAVFAGHVNNGLIKSGVFEQLSKIKKGDYITVESAEGKTQVYRVFSIDQYQPNADTEALFAQSGPEQIVLITCDGDWIPAARTYETRLVVVAKPAY